MRFATKNEIEYLGWNEGHGAADPQLIADMCRRLNALRCLDQNISESDWQPHSRAALGLADSHLRLA